MVGREQSKQQIRGGSSTDSGYGIVLTLSAIPLYAAVLSSLSTSTSNSSMISKTSLKLSINPFTATLNIRFVVALYSVLKISCSSKPRADMVENVRRTSGESSSSTCKALREATARRSVGKHTSIVLSLVNTHTEWYTGGWWGLQRARKVSI